MRRQESLLLCLICIWLFSCKKEMVHPSPVGAVQLQASVSTIVLSQASAAGPSIDFSWASFPDSSGTTVNYTIEAALSGSQFCDAVELLTTKQLSAAFTVRELNEQLRKLVLAGTKELIEFRIRINKAQLPPQYSNTVSVAITTYQSYLLYDESQILRLPGNYQNWTIPSAPRIISAKRDGEYEGYVNFTDPQSQFYLVKGTQWDNVTTYNQTGPSQFGFNGSFFNVTGGAGVYKVNASMSKHTWSCTKIDSWGLYGTAVAPGTAAEADMVFDEAGLSWRITADLVKGDFLFRPNKTNAIVFGHNSESVTGVPDYNGTKISIAKPGNYTIVLSLQSAGNYSYGIQKNK